MLFRSGHDAVAARGGQFAPEQFEDAAALRGARAQGALQHRQLDVTDDKRILLIMIGFCFSIFLEGAAEVMKEKKPKSGMSRIFELASDHKWLLAVSGVLAALAAIASFVPYVAVYYVIRDVISVYPEFNKLNIESVLGYGVIAIIGIAADVILFLSSSI